MSIKDWPSAKRPRERLLEQGAKSLTDAELLAIFLRVGVKGKSAVDLSQDLLDKFGSLRGLLSANQQHFCEGHGLGVAKYVQLQATIEMSRRFLTERVQRDIVVTNAAAIKDFLTIRLRDYSYEVFACLFLDNQHRLIEFRELFNGTINNTSVHPREVVRQSLELNASALIFAHNHPSGVAEPSQADIAMTFTLREALALIDVRVLDHFIVGDEVVSMLEQGKI